MGRTRKLLRDSTADITVIKRTEKEQQERAITDLTRTDLEKPPKELRDAYAKKTWKRILPNLLELPVLCNLDRDNLIGYCNAWSEYVEVLNEQKRAKEIDDIPARTKVMDSLWRREEKALDAQRKYGALCGMSIDSRLKMAAAKQKKEAEQIEERFGVI